MHLGLSTFTNCHPIAIKCGHEQLLSLPAARLRHKHQFTVLAALRRHCYTARVRSKGMATVMIEIPSPAIAIVGRHNSGKTTLIEKLISELVSRGLDVSSVKHHTHKKFNIDYPGKDSYRHRAAGASETVIVAPGQIARIATCTEEVECSEIVRSMPGHDVVIVEGYRKSGLPTIEIMRAANEADVCVATAFAAGAKMGLSIATDFTQQACVNEISANKVVAVNNTDTAHEDLTHKMPTSTTVAIVTDIPQAREAAALYDIPVFNFDDIVGLATFIEGTYVRPRVTVAIQAGGESRRMGRSKATVSFAGRPLICRIVEQLAPAADELIITTNEVDKLAFLKESYPKLDIQLVPDVLDTRGALSGLYTAFSAAHNPYVAIIACDMILASAALVTAEAIVMNEQGVDIVVPVNRHGYEPFHAVYRRDSCLAASKVALAQGQQRVQSIFGDLKVYKFPHKRVLEVVPLGGCFINANTPDELKLLESAFCNEGDG